jgi:diguanylate cyclase (GGDEF)-like protein
VILAYPDIRDALVCAERIRYVCSALSYPNLPESFHITISTGVAHYQPVESVDELIQRADTALYRAKANGRNSVEYQPPLAS